MATYPVKHMHDAMRGAPQINGQPGTLLAALRAFLVTGFGQVAAQSVAVAGGVATATLNAGDTFEPEQIVRVEGASVDALNGEQRVLSATNTSITWATTAPDGAASGSITIKAAPAGSWQELFPGNPDKAVFQSTDPLLGGHCLRIDDSSGQFAAVRGFEAMSDVDTGQMPFPTPAQAPNGSWWIKSRSNSGAGVHYDLFADSAMLLAAITPASSYDAAYRGTSLRGFGAPVALSPAGDAWATCLSCLLTTSTSYPYYGSLCGNLTGVDYGQIFCARAASGLGGSIVMQARAYAGSRAANTLSGADSYLGAFPSAIDGQLKYARRFLCEADNAPRADVPAVLYIPQSGVNAHIAPRDKIPASGQMAGRTLLAVGVGTNAYTTAQGIVLVDITGPWR